MGTIRRVRRVGRAASGGIGSSGSGGSAVLRQQPDRNGGGRVMARGDNDNDDQNNNDDGDGWDWGDSDDQQQQQQSSSSVASGGSKYGKFNSAGREMSLSEKLRQQELLEQQQQQQNQQRGRGGGGRGPLLDSDHTRSKVSSFAPNNNNFTSFTPSNNNKQKPPSSGDSIESGWSWASSSMQSGIHNKGPFKHSKRTMNMVYSAFGEENKIKEKVMSVVNNCTKQKQSGDGYDDEEEGSFDGSEEGHDKLCQTESRKNPHIIIRMAKLVLIALIIFVGVFQIGRLSGHQLGEAEGDDNASSLSMSEQYLRGKGSMESGMLLGNNALRFSGKQPSLDSFNNGNNNEQSNNTTANNNANNVIIHQAYFPPHLAHLSNLTTAYNPTIETPYFWDVHFSGESVAEHVFATCHGLVMAAEFGLRQMDYNEEKLETFLLDKALYVNVDTTTPEGIQRASQLNLAQSHLANVIISPHVHSMANQIFSPSNPGRMFALFRHPVDRALSMYYYLAKASWDPHYNPALSKMSVEQFANSRYIENNFVTRFLVNKPRGKLSHGDMLLAKKIVKFKCLVGLYEDMEVSMARFQRYFGWNAANNNGGKKDNKAQIAKCRSDLVAQGDKNVLGHPVSIKEGEYASPSSLVSAVRAGSVAWNAIVRMNKFDMELYEFVKRIYRIQGEQIFDVVGYEPQPPLPAVDASRLEDNRIAENNDMMENESSMTHSGKSMAFDTVGGSSGKKMMALDALYQDMAMDMSAIDDNNSPSDIDMGNNNNMAIVGAGEDNRPVTHSMADALNDGLSVDEYGGT